MTRSPPEAAVERFRRDCLALTGEVPSPQRRLGLAVSGGPDSMALLLLAATAFPGAVRAATVDHGLRPEARDEAAMVAAWCRERGIAHAVLARGGGAGATPAGNLQEHARTLRYELLRHWAFSGGDAGTSPWVAVAHQRDDVAESLLMRARRGAGVGGMAAMARSRPIDPARPGPLLVRPLLEWSRAELLGILRCTATPFAEDRTNRDPRFDRSRMRALLARTTELSPGRLAHAAQNLRHAEDALAWWVARELPARLRDEADDRVAVDVGNLPYELRRRLARAAIERVRTGAGAQAPWHEQGLDRLVAALDRGETATLANVVARPQGTRWRFAPAPPRRSL